MKYRPRAAKARSPKEQQQNLDRLRAHTGTASLWCPTGTNNAGIDRDLTREYEGTYR